MIYSAKCTRQVGKAGMDNLKVVFGSEVAIYSSKTNGFLRYDIESRRVKADGIHPFLKVWHSIIQATWRDQEKSVSLEEFRIYSEKDQSQKSAISFGSHIFIINK